MLFGKELPPVKVPFVTNFLKSQTNTPSDLLRPSKVDLPFIHVYHTVIYALLPPASPARLPRVLGRHLSGSTALLSERTIDEQNLDAL